MTNIPQEILKKVERLPRFQQKVYLACAEIPKGQIRTYQWIAKTIGHPRAARAVGTALKKNPFVPFIPCHRVVRSDGKIGQYSGRGGSKGKEALLKKEGALKK